MVALVLVSGTPAWAALVFSVHAITTAGVTDTAIETAGVVNLSAVGQSIMVGIFADITTGTPGQDGLQIVEGSLRAGSATSVIGDFSLLPEATITTTVNNGGSTGQVAGSTNEDYLASGNPAANFDPFNGNSSAPGTLQDLTGPGRGIDVGTLTNNNGDTGNFVAISSGLAKGNHFLIGVFQYTLNSAVNTGNDVIQFLSSNQGTGANSDPVWKEATVNQNHLSGTITDATGTGGGLGSALTIHYTGASSGNDSQLVLSGAGVVTGSGGATTLAKTFNVVAGTTASATIGLSKSGTSSTTYTLTAGGATPPGTLSDNNGTPGAFAGGAQSSTLTYGFTAGQTATSGTKSGTITVANTGSGVTDGNDVITATVNVFQAAFVTAPSSVSAGSPIVLTNAASSDGGQRALAEIGTGTSSFVQGTGATVTGDFQPITFAANSIALATTTGTTVSSNNVALTPGALPGTHFGTATISFRTDSTLTGASATGSALTVQLQGTVTGTATGTGTANVPLGATFGNTSGGAVGLGITSDRANSNTQPPFPTPTTSSAINKTVAQILFGANVNNDQSQITGGTQFTTSSALNITIGNWREKGKDSAGNQQSTLTTSGNYDGGEASLISDIVNVNFGLGAGHVQTPTFVLQMKYDPAMFDSNYDPNNPNSPASQAVINKLNSIQPQLAYNANQTGTSLTNPAWDMAVSGNFGVGNLTTPNTVFQQSWDAFAAAHSITQANIDSFLGSQGWDPSNNVAWAVLNHNSEFAVVPEPSSLALAGLGVALIGWRKIRRNRKK